MFTNARKNTDLSELTNGYLTPLSVRIIRPNAPNKICLKDKLSRSTPVQPILSNVALQFAYNRRYKALNQGTVTWISQ